MCAVVSIQIHVIQFGTVGLREYKFDQYKATKINLAYIIRAKLFFSQLALVTFRTFKVALSVYSPFNASGGAGADTSPQARLSQAA